VGFPSPQQLHVDQKIVTVRAPRIRLVGHPVPSISLKPSRCRHPLLSCPPCSLPPLDPPPPRLTSACWCYPLIPTSPRPVLLSIPPTPASSSGSVDIVSFSRILHRWPCRCLCRHRFEESLSGTILDVLGPVEAILAAARRGKVWSILPLWILRRQARSLRRQSSRSKSPFRILPPTLTRACFLVLGYSADPFIVWRTWHETRCQSLFTRTCFLHLFHTISELIAIRCTKTAYVQDLFF
jgi:hypothetical protein